MGVEENLWSVKLPSGDIRSGTLEQLDEAFQAGLIGDGALVRAAGSDDWVKLSDLLAGAEGATAPSAAPAPAPIEAPSSTPTLVQPHPSISAGAPASPPARTDLTPAAAAPAPTPPPTSATAAATATPAPAPVVVPFAGASSVVPSQLAASARKESDADVWQLRLPSGGVRSGTRRQLEEALAAGHIDSNALVIPFGAHDWVKLSSTSLGATTTMVASAGTNPAAPPLAASPSTPPVPSAPPPQATEHDQWQVKLPSGELRSGTRQQLEEAFHAGHLDGTAQALAAGSREWVALNALFTRTPGTRPTPAPSTSPPPASRLPAKGLQAAVRPASSVPAARAPTQPPQPAAQEPVEHRDLWQVSLTRKQLGDALRMGLLTELTMVLGAGATEAVRLGVVLRSNPQTHPPAGVVRPRVSAPPATAPSKAPEVAPPVRADAQAPAETDGQARGEAKDVWQVKLPSGEVRAGSRKQLEEALDAGHLDPNLLVLAAGATEWTKLNVAIAQASAKGSTRPNVAPSAATPPSVAPSVAANPSVAQPTSQQDSSWQARLPSGELRSGSQGQLEEALRQGHLGADTLVRSPGATEWVTLGSLAEAAPPTNRVPVVVPTAVASEPRPATATADWPPAVPETALQTPSSPLDAAAEARATDDDFERAKAEAARTSERNLVNGEVRTELAEGEPGGGEEPTGSDSPST